MTVTPFPDLLPWAVLPWVALLWVALAALSALVVRGMVGLAVLDRPGPRKAHARPVPKGGGVGVVAAFLVGLAALHGLRDPSPFADSYAPGVVLAAAAVAAVAFADDVLDWPFTAKLGAQLGAAALAAGSGLWVRRVDVPGLGAVELGWLGVPLTLAWIVFATNAVNFIDGLNGLAAGTCLVACACLGAIAAAHGGGFILLACALLTAGLAGFLPFNYQRARIFMGDVGSQFCGFLLAALGVAAARLPGVELAVLLVPMLLAGVLFDVAFTLARRALAGERLTQPHRGHLYQVAHRSGVNPAAIAAVHWGFAAWGGACCWLLLAAPGPAKPLAALLALLPQLLWLAWVARRARRAALGRW